MFIVALFTIAKIWQQPKCPSINEWIKKKKGRKEVTRKAGALLLNVLKISNTQRVILLIKWKNRKEMSKTPKNYQLWSDSEG